MISAVFFGLVGAQIRVLSPQSLLQKFAATKGNIVGTTAVFGTPYYGDRVLGRLVYGESAGQAHCTDEDYHAPLAAANGYQNHDQGDYNYQGQSSPASCSALFTSGVKSGGGCALPVPC